MYFIYTYAAVYTEWLLIPWTVQFILLQAPSALIFCYILNFLKILFKRFAYSRIYDYSIKDISK